MIYITAEQLYKLDGETIMFEHLHTARKEYYERLSRKINEYLLTQQTAQPKKRNVFEDIEFARRHGE